MQEEPENMGAWDFVRPVLEQLIDGRCPLRYVGRARNSSPSEGSAAWHQVNQRALVVAQAFESCEAANAQGLGRAAGVQRHASEEPWSRGASGFWRRDIRTPSP